MRDLPDPWRGESYYAQPALKNPQWDWKVSGYIALVGVAGAAQALAFLGRLRDREGFRGAERNAGRLALGAVGVGSALLIADLKTPRRFYNMLRILRPTSPMSFGSYILGAFGGLSALGRLRELNAVRRSPVLRDAAAAAQAGAAITGAGAATYTAALMSATSNPYWAAAPRELGGQFATSAVAGGAAALALGERLDGRRLTAERLEDVAAVATVAHLVASAAADRRRRAVGVGKVMAHHPEEQRLKTADLALAGVAPLAGYAINRGLRGRAPAAAVAGSLAVLAGGWMVRHAILRTGKSAAMRPDAAFRLAQPENLALTVPPAAAELPR